MQLYHFIRRFYSRGESRLNTKQKRNFRLAIETTVETLTRTIDQYDLQYLERIANNPPGELARKFLENSLHIMRGQPLYDLQMQCQEIDLAGITEIEFTSILNVPQRQLIIPYYGHPNVEADLAVLCGLIENFSGMNPLPEEYALWDLMNQSEPIVIQREHITPIPLEELVAKASQMMPPPNFPFGGPSQGLHI